VNTRALVAHSIENGAQNAVICTDRNFREDLKSELANVQTRKVRVVE
jgi:carbamoylphosphate synthase small subunit